MRHGVERVGEGAHQHALRAGLGRGNGPSSALVPGAAVGCAGVDQQRIHGAVEQHDVPGGVKRVEGVEVLDHKKGAFEPIFARGGHGAAKGGDAQFLSFLARKRRASFGDVAARPRRNRHGHHVGRVRPGRLQHLPSPFDGPVRARRTAQTVPDVLAQDAQVLVGFSVRQDFVEDGANEGAVGGRILGLSRGQAQQGGRKEQARREAARQHSKGERGIHGTKGSGMCPNLAA